MKLQEKKYLVDSFIDIQRHLNEVGAVPGKKIIATHYYGRHDGNDVEKFVAYDDRCEIHVLKESDGKFTMTEHRPIPNKEAGLAWLTSKGFSDADIVKMAYTEYAYKNGTIGLYVIDDFLHSVILYFLPEEHSIMEQEFGLQNAEVISLPYNKYLKKLGKLRSMTL